MGCDWWRRVIGEYNCRLLKASRRDVFYSTDDVVGSKMARETRWPMPLQVVSRLRTYDCSGQVNNMTASAVFAWLCSRWDRGDGTREEAQTRWPMPLQVVSRLRTSDCSVQVNNMTANVRFEVQFSLGSAAGETEGMELVNGHRQGDRCLCRWCHG